MSDSMPSGFIDPDVESLRGRPLHLRPRYLYVIFVGGVLGTMARWAVGHVLPPEDGWPWGTFVVNLTGSFVLGVLLEELVRRGDDHGWRRLARLHLGTGFCGAYTTYSALAVDSVLLVDHGRPALAAGYLAATLLGGVVAAWAGIVVAAGRWRGRDGDRVVT